MAPVCPGAFINTLAWSERACSGASDLWLVTGSCALFRGRGCTPVRGIFRGKFYDGLFDAASSHQLSNRRKEHECSIRQLQLQTRISLHSHSKEDSNVYSFAGERASEKPPPYPPHSPFHSYFCFITLSLAFEDLRIVPLFPSPHLRHLSAHFIVVESCAASREMHSFVIGLWPSANSRSPLTL